MSMLIVSWGIFKRDLLLFIRYIFDSVSSLVVLYTIYIFIFFGIKIIADNPVTIGNTIEAFTVGFILWVLTIDAYSKLSHSIFGEAQWGTLEQLYLCPFGFGWVSVSIILSSLIFNLLISSVLLVLIMITTGKYLHLDIIALMPTIIVTLMGITGIGFVMGGLALVFKKVNSFFQVIQFAFVILMAVPQDRVPIMKYLPLSTGYKLIRMIMQDQTNMIRYQDVLSLIINSICYLICGYIIYKVLEKKAKREGMLGQY